MSTSTRFVLLAVTACLALSIPLAAQATAGNNSAAIVASSSTVNSYDVTARNIVRLYAACYSGSSCYKTMASDLAQIYLVPAGKRLVITGYNIYAGMPSGSTALVYLNLGPLLIYPEMHPSSINYFGTDIWISSATGPNLYVDQGQGISVGGFSTTYFYGFTVSAWGYLVDCGTAGCTKG